MATRSSILAWEIPWTEEAGRLQSMGSHRVGQWSDLAQYSILSQTPLESRLPHNIEQSSLCYTHIYLALAYGNLLSSWPDSGADLWPKKHQSQLFLEFDLWMMRERHFAFLWSLLGRLGWFRITAAGGPLSFHVENSLWNRSLGMWNEGKTTEMRQERWKETVFMPAIWVLAWTGWLSLCHQTDLYWNKSRILFLPFGLSEIKDMGKTADDGYGETGSFICYWGEFNLVQVL